MTQPKVSGEHRIVFFLCLAVLAGPALNVLFENDLSEFPDCNTYTALARFDFDQSTVRRYRLLIPMAAALIDMSMGDIFSRLAPHHYEGDFSLPFCFFLINLSLMGFFGQLVYRFCRSFGVDRLSAFVGTLATLTARFTVYFAALPFTDSLFCVVVAMTLLGIRIKSTWMLLFCIFVGPFAKESFIFIAPLIFFFGHIKRPLCALYFISSGILVFTFHYVYDQLSPPAKMHWLAADVSHFGNVLTNIYLLFSFYGIYKILLNIGLWLIPLVAGLMRKVSRQEMKKVFDNYLVWFLAAVLLQMLLSGSFERMFYLAMPVISVMVAVSFMRLKDNALLAGDKS